MMTSSRSPRLGFRRGLALVILSGAAVVLLAAPRGDKVRRFTTPSANSQPGAIVAGADGALWFIERGTGAIGRITTAGEISEFPIAAGGVLSSLAAAPDGSIWFAESSAGRIGRITNGGSVSEFSILEGGQPIGIAFGPDGNIWYTNAAGTIGRLAPDSSVVEFAVPSGEAYGIAAGDNSLWFTEPGANKIGRMGTGGGGAIEYTVPTSNGRPTAIVAGGDHNYWFIEVPLQGPFAPESRIGRVSTVGGILDFTTSVPHSQPGALAIGRDGNIWFTDPPSNTIRSIGPFGKLLRVKIKADRPAGIAAGPDGAIWFTEQPNGIGRISLE